MDLWDISLFGIYKRLISLISFPEICHIAATLIMVMCQRRPATSLCMYVFFGKLSLFPSRLVTENDVIVTHTHTVVKVIYM